MLRQPFRVSKAEVGGQRGEVRGQVSDKGRLEGCHLKSGAIETNCACIRKRALSCLGQAHENSSSTPWKWTFLQESGQLGAGRSRRAKFQHRSERYRVLRTTGHLRRANHPATRT